MPLNNPSARPIFILGIMQRSGTNFLYQLLRSHPDCQTCGPEWEDFLVHHSEWLIRYAHELYRHWTFNPAWGVEPILESQVCQCLGSGLISFLNLHIDGKRLITKTPSVRHLNYLFKLFPNAYLVILIRDGRSVIESGVKTFGWDYETATRRWVNAAQTISKFEQTNQQNSKSYLIVRYEDLVNNLKDELTKIFTFLSLDIETYDFDAAINQPVLGSSTFIGQKEKSVHWQPVAKNSDFKPIERWNKWNQAKHERFNWLAGKSLTSFHYAIKHYEMSEIKRKIWSVWNIVLDLKWTISHLLR